MQLADIPKGASAAAAGGGEELMLQNQFQFSIGSILHLINSQFSKSICTLSDVMSQLSVPNYQFSKSIHNYCKMVYLKHKLKRKPLLLLLLLWTLLEAFVSLGNLCFCLLWAPFGFECSAPVIRQEFDPGREEWEIDKAKAFGRTHD